VVLRLPRKQLSMRGRCWRRFDFCWETTLILTKMSQFEIDSRLRGNEPPYSIHH
jgi:hypothetical protein